MEISDRLKAFIDHSGLSSSQFADLAGIPRPTLSQVLNGRNKKVSNELVGKLHASFPNLNILWLLFGEGEMGQVPNIEFSEAKNADISSIFDVNTPGDEIYTETDQLQTSDNNETDPEFPDSVYAQSMSGAFSSAYASVANGTPNLQTAPGTPQSTPVSTPSNTSANQTVQTHEPAKPSAMPSATAKVFQTASAAQHSASIPNYATTPVTDYPRTVQPSAQATSGCPVAQANQQPVQPITQSQPFSVAGNAPAVQANAATPSNQVNPGTSVNNANPVNSANSVNPANPVNPAMSPYPQFEANGKRIAYIMVFYTDKSFETFNPSEPV